MHEREVVESDLIDSNLVGCLDHKALIIKANSYEQVCGARCIGAHSCMAVRFARHGRVVPAALCVEGGAFVRPGALACTPAAALCCMCCACTQRGCVCCLLRAQALEQLPPASRGGEWHFCRGVLRSDTQTFHAYEELGALAAACCVRSAACVGLGVRTLSSASARIQRAVHLCCCCWVCCRRIRVLPAAMHCACLEQRTGSIGMQHVRSSHQHAPQLTLFTCLLMPAVPAGPPPGHIVYEEEEEEEMDGHDSRHHPPLQIGRLDEAQQLADVAMLRQQVRARARRTRAHSCLHACDACVQMRVC